MIDASQGVSTGARRPSRRSTLVGVLGELLVTAGALLALFVVWQLWWTDVQASRVQQDLLSSITWPTPSNAGAPEIGDGDPPRTPAPAPGELYGLLFVPAWGPQPRTILEGVDPASVLDVGSAGHYPGTAGPGEIGNFALAGHRTTYGKPFSRVDELVPGDDLVVRTEDAWYVYEVTRTQIVSPADVGVVAPVPQGDSEPARYLTLTACHPRYSAAERYIVHGELVRWLPGTSAPPDELRDGGGAVSATAAVAAPGGR